MKKNDLILVIDMQKAYDEGQPWACEHMAETSQNILKIIREVDQKDVRVIFTRFIADPDAKYGWKRYNEINREVNENAEMNEIVDELKSCAASHETYDKAMYSALRVPKIRKACEETNAAGGRIILCGVVDDCCVLSTFFEALDDGAYLVWVKDAIAGINAEKHHSTEVVVEGLTYCHCTMMNTNEYLKEE